MSLPPKFAKSHLLLPRTSNAAVFIDVFLDYCCPYSTKLYVKWYDELLPKLDQIHHGKFQVVFRNVVQPWHPSSTLMHEAALTVATLAPEKFGKFSYDLFVEQARWYDAPTRDKSRREIYKELSEFAAEKTGLSSSSIFELLEIAPDSGNAGNQVTNDIKYFTRYQRQNSTHVTPTVAVNGVTVGSIESSTSVKDVIKLLEGYL